MRTLGEAIRSGGALGLRRIGARRAPKSRRGLFVLLVLGVLLGAGGAGASDLTMDLTPGWTMGSPDAGDLVRCDLSLEPGKTAAVFYVKRIDFDSVEEAAGFGKYLREQMRYDDSTTLLKVTEGLVSGIPSVVHLVVERRQSGTYQQEISYVLLEKAWFQFGVLTTPELFAQVKLRSDELLSRVRLGGGAAGQGGTGAPGQVQTGGSPYASGGAGVSSQTQTWGSPPSLDGTGVTHQVAGTPPRLNFNVPPPWVPGNPPDPSVKASFLLPEGSQVRAELLVFEEAFTDGNVDLYFQRVQAYAPTAFASFESLGTASVPLAGREGRRLDFRFSPAGKMNRLRGRFFALVEGGRAFGFLFDCGAQDFDALASAFDGIMTSVSFADAGGAGTGGSVGTAPGPAPAGVYTDAKGLYSVPLPPGAALQESLLFGAIYSMPAGGQISFFTFEGEEPVANTQAQVASGKTPHGESRIAARGREAVVALYSSVNAETKVAYATLFVRFPGTGALVIVSVPADRYQESQGWILPFIQSFQFR